MVKHDLTWVIISANRLLYVTLTLMVKQKVFFNLFEENQQYLQGSI